VEKMVVRAEPTLQRKLKSRHLQMIAIGTPHLSISCP
jgi:amino acid permease